MPAMTDDSRETLRPPLRTGLGDPGANELGSQIRDVLFLRKLISDYIQNLQIPRTSFLMLELGWAINRA